MIFLSWYRGIVNISSRNCGKRKLSWIYFIYFLVDILFSCTRLHFTRSLVQLKSNYPLTQTFQYSKIRNFHYIVCKLRRPPKIPMN